MKAKRLTTALTASAIALSSLAFSVSADDPSITYNPSTGGGATASTGGGTALAGIAFQTSGTWNYRNQYDGTGTGAAFPAAKVGVQGGAYGVDENVACTDVHITGDGSYTVKIATKGTITSVDGAAKGVFALDDESEVSRVGTEWSMLANTETIPVEGENTRADNYQWSTETSTKADKFNMLLISTEIPCKYKNIDGFTGKQPVMDDNRHVIVTVDSIDMGNGEVKPESDVTYYKYDEKYVTVNLINAYGKSTFDENMLPTDDCEEIVVKFSVKFEQLPEEKEEPAPTPTPTPAVTPTPSKTVTKQSIAKAKVTVKDQVYTGKALKPAATVKLGSKTLKKGTDYTVSYKNNKKIGKATATVTGKGNYTGTVSKTFKINPKKVTVKKAAAVKGKKLKVTWKKDASVTGYQVKIATDKSFKKNAKTVTVKKAKTVSKTFSKLKAGKKYYVKVRAYKTVGKVKYYGAFSKLKTSAKIKK